MGTSNPPPDAAAAWGRRRDEEDDKFCPVVPASKLHVAVDGVEVKMRLHWARPVRRPRESVHTYALLETLRRLQCRGPIRSSC